MEHESGSPGAPNADEALLGLMLDHATDGICLVAGDGTILATTSAIERMLGETNGALRGTNGLELLHPEDVDAALDRLGRLGEDVPEDYRTYRFQHADGHYITVELVASENPVPLDGAPDGSLVLTVRDMTEWDETRLALDRSRVRRELVASLAAMFVDAFDIEIDETVNRALRAVSAHTGTDRAYVFRLNEDATTMRRTHGWARAGRTFRTDENVAIPTDLYAHWRDQILALEVITVDTARVDSEWRIEQETLAGEGVMSLLAVPLVREAEAVGFLAVDVFDRPHTWSSEDIEVLKVITDIIGSALARREASEQSRTAEVRFRAMVGHSSDALIVLDRDGQINHLPIGENLFGYQPHELFGTNALDLVHPDDLEFAATEMLRAVTDPTYYAINAMRIRHADGHWVPIELVASSWFDEPAIDGVIMNVRDVTERNRVEAQLRESEERLRLLIANLPGAVFRCQATPPYRDEFMSEAVELLTGYPADDFVSQRVIFDELVLPEHLERSDQEVEAAIASGGPYIIEYPIRHRDGSIRWISENGRVFHETPGDGGYLEGFMFDITSRVVAIAETKASETKLEHLIANVPGAVFRCEIVAPYRDIFISDAVSELCGYDAGTFYRGDVEFYDLVVPEQRAALDRSIAQSVEHGHAYAVEFQFRHRDGSLRWIEERGQVVRNELGEPMWIDGAMFDLTERKQLEARLEHDAMHDPLTGLPNRTLLVQHLETTLHRSHRNGGITAALFVDLDRFKLVNDALGHAAGDELLVLFSRRLLGVMRSSDLAARTGGDEFVIICSDLVDADEAENIAGRIADLLREPFTVRGRSVFVNASVGIAIADGDDASADDVLRDADAAAYRAKDRGRNRYEVFDDALRAATAAALEVETDLHRALDDHQLFLRYQPVVEIASGRLVGAEGLVRWQHPERGLLAPDEFLPAAEVSGLIVALGREVLELAVGAMSGVDESTLPSVAINFSPRELAQPDVVDRVRSTLERHGVEPRRLCIEITETAVLDEVDTAIATLNALRDIGVRLAIDDFGTGYSSLSYLRRLPVDIVKIDRSFTGELGIDGANLTIVAGIIGLAGGLGLEVIAEGIETPRQLEVLRELGCTFGQGYLFAAPVALDDMLSLNSDGWAAPFVRH